jgi:uncharacterized protein YcnI
MRLPTPSLPFAVGRPLALACGVAAAGVLLLAPAAAADVSITPATAVQGGETGVTFLVENQRSGAYTTKVEVDLPADAPIAEVYPMTVPDWAPQIISRAADQPLPGIHGSGLSTATSAVIWTRADDAPPAPQVEHLRLEMGPLPEVDRFVFTVVQTYSDGTVKRWSGPGTSGGGTVLTLSRPVAAAADGGQAGGHGHGAAEGQDSDQAAGAAPAPAPAQAPVAATATVGDGGMSLLDIVVGGGLAVAVVLVVLRAAAGSRTAERREEPASPEVTADAGSPADSPADAGEDRATVR